MKTITALAFTHGAWPGQQVFKQIIDLDDTGT